nr:ATP-dependent helicase [Patescibacteria group bacterium]
MQLNKEQQIAVETPGNLFIRACPGSGKTRVITHKIAYNLERMTTQKRRVIAVTFTNRAADQIFNRVNQMGIDTTQLWTGTIHSFCLEWILKPYSSFHPALKRGFTILDDAVREKIERDLKDSYGLPSYTDLNFRIDKNNKFECDYQQEDLVEDFYSILQEKKEISYEQMLLFSYEIVKNNSAIAKSLSAIFSLICVDEYQDTQELQYAILAEIIMNSDNRTDITFVGDPDQSIYESLGGIAKTLEEIEVEMGRNFINLHLSGNYRTNQRIIDFYKNFQSTPEKINAVGVNKDEIGLITYNKEVDKNDIPLEISKLIKYHLSQNIPEKEICILVPQWWLIRSITSKLKELLPDVNFDATGMTPLSSQRENVWYKISRLFLTEPSPQIYHYRRRWANEIRDDIDTIIGNTEFSNSFNPSKILKIIN